MAYAFDKISDLINQNAGQSNIFQGGGQPMPQGQPSGNSGVLKQGEGGSDVGQSGGASNVVSGSQAPQTQIQTPAVASARAIAGGGNYAPTKAIGDISSGIESSQKNTEKEASTYAKNAVAPARDWDTGELQKSVSSGDFSKVIPWLTPQAYSGSYSPTSVYDPTSQLNTLKTQKGLADIAGKEHGAGYRGGVAKASADLTLQNPEYQKTLSLLGEKGGKASEAIKSAAEKANTAASTGFQSAADKRKQDVIKSLRFLETNLKNQGESRAQDEIKKIQALGSKDAALGLTNPILEELKQDPNNPLFLDRAKAAVDPMAYLKVDTSAPSWQDMMRQEEINQYSNIEKLLGYGGEKPTDLNLSGYGGAESRRTFDAAGYKKAMLDALTKLKTPTVDPLIDAISGMGGTGGGAGGDTAGGAVGLPTSLPHDALPSSPGDTLPWLGRKAAETGGQISKIPETVAKPTPPTTPLPQTPVVKKTISELLHPRKIGAPITKPVALPTAKKAAEVVTKNIPALPPISIPTPTVQVPTADDLGGLGGLFGGGGMSYMPSVGSAGNELSKLNPFPGIEKLFGNPWG